MKRIMLVMFALCAMVLVSSCSSDDEVVTELEPQTVYYDSLRASDFESLKVQFAAFNNDYFNAYYASGKTPMFATNGYTVQTRGWLSRFFNKFLAIVTCDLVGAKWGFKATGGNVVGGIVGAVIGSGIGVVGDACIIPRCGMVKRAAATDGLNLPDYVNSEDVVFDNLVLTENADNETLADSVGYYHNKILYDYCTKVNKQGLLVSENKNDFVISVMEDLEDSLNCDFGTMEQKEELAENILAEAQKVSDLLQTSTSIEDFISKLKAEYPDYAEELSVLEEYIKGIGMLEIEEDEGEYAKRLLKIVDASSLAEEQKEQMRISIDVGHASSHLWNASAFEKEQENTETSAPSSSEKDSSSTIVY